MTSIELIELFNSKKRELCLTYQDLLDGMDTLGIRFRSRVYRGDKITSYLTQLEIHRLARLFGVDLYE